MYRDYIVRDQLIRGGHFIRIVHWNHGKYGLNNEMVMRIMTRYESDYECMT